MAYVDFREPAPLAGTVSVAIKQQFSAIEWLVIGLARRDRLASLSQPSRIARAMRSLFGLGEQSQLADERLEALRRMAVLVWHRGWNLPKSELKAFLRRFDSDQLETLVAAIGREKSAPRSR